MSMSEWQDSTEREARRNKRRAYTFITRLDHDIRRLHRYGFIYWCLGLGNAELAVQGFVWAWATDTPWRAGLAGCSLLVAGLSFLGARKMRRQAHFLRALKDSTAGMLAAKTPTQMEHYAEQGDAAIRDLKDS
jgi:hypothetical protein